MANKNNFTLHQMKISVITPVKNSEKYLAETIESAINQHGNFEIEYLIFDGLSTDDTLKICKEYEDQLCNLGRKVFCNSIEFKVISEPDNGMYHAISRGLGCISGDITCYLNGDDFYLPNAFSCVTEIFTKFPEVKWISGLPSRFNESGQHIEFYVPWGYNSKLISKGFNGTKLPIIQQESVFWRSELNHLIAIQQLQHFKLAGDFFLWSSFAKNKVQLYVVDSFLGGNRKRKGQMSEDKAQYFNEMNSIKDKANPLDYFLVFLFWVIDKFAGKPVKQKLSKHRLYYKKGKWRKS